MAAHNELGKEGEDLAARWLADKGYKILHRNWQQHPYEIDIVASKGKFLHFIEVKTRKGDDQTRPESSVTKQKFKSLKWAVNAYLRQNPGNKWIQYDIIAITLKRNGEKEYFFMEDVYL